VIKCDPGASLLSPRINPSNRRQYVQFTESPMLAIAILSTFIIFMGVMNVIDFGRID